mgnify:CR=1 FL=1
MKPEEAIERLEYLESALDGYPPETGINDVFAAIDTAIEALKEAQQYREIGTVEECREAVEKQKPKKCVIDSCPDHTHYKCPSCGKIHLSRYKHGCPSLGRIPRFCEYCGQAIKDEDLEEMEDENT